MIRSMTAFASAERATPWGTLACEVRAVNHRFLELGVRAPEELRAEFQALLAGRRPDEVVLGCGSGVTACHNLLAMEHAGLPGARVHAASWSGWIADPARPVATAPGPVSGPG